jgi:hypothetical protein
MALVTVTLHGQILDPDGLTPAVGTVRFQITQELRDTVSNVIYSPTEFMVTLNGTGEFTIILPTTDNAQITPLDWTYRVVVATDVWTETFRMSLPGPGPIVEFADLLPPVSGNGSSCTPDGTACAPISHTHEDFFIENLTVPGTTTTSYQGITGDITRFMSTALSTGVTSGGAITINANPALIDIGPMTGWIVNYNSSGVIGPTNPQLTFVSIPGTAGIALTGPPTQSATWWLVDSVGTILQQAPEPTPTQRRTHIVLGASAQFAGINFLVQDIPTILNQPANQFADLAEALGPFNSPGFSNTISANGANLMINTAGGSLFSRAFALPAYQDPNIAIIAAQSPANFRRATATAVGGVVVNTLDVANYDPGGLGVITPIGGGINTSTIHRVYAFGSTAVNEQMAIQYGQSTYASLAAAIAAIGTGSFVENPLFVNGALVAYIVATRAATDLSNAAQANFTKAARFATP